MKRQADVYRKVGATRYPKGIVIAYEPIISDEENAKRMKRLHDSAAELLMSQKKQA